jgi:hypothetical protein
VDVTLGTEGKKLPAHKMLLSACSPYFRELLKVLSSSVLRIRAVYPGYDVFPSRIHIKEFKYFKPKKCFLTSQKYDPGCSSRIPAPDPDFFTYSGSC